MELSDGPDKDVFEKFSDKVREKGLLCAIFNKKALTGAAVTVATAAILTAAGISAPLSVPVAILAGLATGSVLTTYRVPGWD
ncbi:MAG: hypothetical protein V1721_07300 [Pseudomonadota bacterium]